MQPAIISHTGALQASPATSPLGGSTLNDILNTSFAATYSSRKASSPSIVNATDGSPFVVDFESIVKTRAVALKVNSGTLKVLVTSAAGTDQAFRCSSLWLWHGPFSGDEITGLKFVGTADIELILAGDVS